MNYVLAIYLVFFGYYKKIRSYLLDSYVLRCREKAGQKTWVRRGKINSGLHRQDIVKQNQKRVLADHPTPHTESEDNFESHKT